MMYRIGKAAGILIVAVLIMTAVGYGVLADEHTGDGPDSALAPGTWTEASFGTRTWYAFTYGGDKKAIEVNLFSDPKDGTEFCVITPGQAAEWRRTGKITYVGAGSENSAVKSDRFWTGEFDQSGTYYVMVEHSKVRAQPARYQLVVQGDGIGMPAMTAETPALAAPAAAARSTMPEMAELVVQPGSNPGAAVAPGGWQAIDQNGEIWFAFDYGKKKKTLRVQLDVEPNGAVEFMVYTPQNMANWARGGQLESIGAGAENRFVKGDLFWTGKFYETGTYYVRVKSTGLQSGPINFHLNVQGSGVSY